MKLIDRLKGGIYGVAIGDALGAPIEFLDADQIARKYEKVTEMIGGGWLNVKPGQFTDDTEMMLAVAEGIMTDPEDPIPHIGQAFIRWRDSGPIDIGGTIRTVFRIWDRDNLTHEQWHVAAERAHNELRGKSAGNGALMRTLPVGIAYRLIPDIYCRAMEIARMTHWDMKAGLTCAIYSLAVRNIINGEQDKFLALVDAIRTVKEITPDAEGVLEEIEQYLILIRKNRANLKPTGYTVDSFMCAAWAFTESESFEDAVIKAVNLGGDADTIGAIAGGLAGVYYGFWEIPERWVHTLHRRDALDRVITGLTKTPGMRYNRTDVRN